MAKRIRIIIPALILALLAVALFWYISRQRNLIPPGTLFANGTIEATEIDISPQIAGKITAVAVDEGDRVSAGQLVVSLHAEEIAAQLQQAQGSLVAAEASLAELHAGTRAEEIRRAQAHLEAAHTARAQAQARLDLVLAGPREEVKEQLRANVASAEIALAEASRELARIELLFSQGAAASQQVDLARTRRDAAAASLEAARQKLREAESGSRPEEIRAAEAALAQSETQVQSAQATLDLALAGPRQEAIAAAAGRREQALGALQAAQSIFDYTRISAPADGTVILRNVEPGEFVTPGMPLLRLALLDKMWLRVYIPEPKLGLVKLGQRAEVVSDTFPDRKYPGRIVEIDQEAQFTPKNVQTREERVKLVFGLKIAVENPAGELKPGMPADAYIYVDSNTLQD